MKVHQWPWAKKIPPAAPAKWGEMIEHHAALSQGSRLPSHATHGHGHGSRSRLTNLYHVMPCHAMAMSTDVDVDVDHAHAYSYTAKVPHVAVPLTRSWVQHILMRFETSGWFWNEL